MGAEDIDDIQNINDTEAYTDLSFNNDAIYKDMQISNIDFTCKLFCK